MTKHKKTEPSVNERLRCTICKAVKQTYSEIVYSEGDRVCTECKKTTLESDKMSFDYYMNSRR